MRTATKPSTRQHGRRAAHLARQPMPVAPRARPRLKKRPRRVLLLPIGILLALVMSHLTAVAMLNYEYARQASLRREIDRTQLNIDRLQGQLAAYTDEIALRTWAEQAGMVRVDEQSELTMVGLDTPPVPPQPVAMAVYEP
ncbi:MAG: hypothetical protein ACUVV1_01495 [Fimbriimonadales bacterium]